MHLKKDSHSFHTSKGEVAIPLIPEKMLVETDDQIEYDCSEEMDRFVKAFPSGKELVKVRILT